MKRTISYGSSGDDVKELQKALNENGYSLSLDGKFGAATQAALKDYQKKNNLSVDGIAGTQTWSSLNKKSGSSVSGTQGNFTYKVSKPVYEKSKDVIHAEKDLKQWEDNKPTEYNSKYSQKIDEILNAIINREDFDYKLSADPLYEQYKELYINNGKKAMMDTIGQSTALTGGYSNSYAQAVGNEVYNDYLMQLDDVALDLRDMAFKEYKEETGKLMDDVSLLRSLDGDDYKKYLNELERYYNDGDYLLKKLANMNDQEFEMFTKELESWENDRNFAFENYQDSLDRAEFEEEMAFKRAEAQRDQQNKDRSYAQSNSKSAFSVLEKLKEEKKKSKEAKKDSGTDKKEYIIYPKSYKEFYDRTGVSTILTKEEFDTSPDYKSEYKYDYLNYLKAMYDKYKE